MRKKFLKLVCICAMVSSLIMGGCGDTQETKDSTNETATTKENDTKENTTSDKSGEYPYGTFDVDEICKHIEINGKQVDFPFTLNDLGEDYEFVRCEEYSEGIYSGFITYKGEEILGMSSYEENELNRDSVISDIYIFCYDVNNTDILSMCGIKRGSKIEKIIETFGEPTEKSEDSFSGMYFYKSEKGFVSISYFKENGVIDDCHIIVSDLEMEEN